MLLPLRKPLELYSYFLRSTTILFFVFIYPTYNKENAKERIYFGETRLHIA